MRTRLIFALLISCLFSFRATGAPPNDLFAQRIDIGQDVFLFVEGSNESAGTEPGEDTGGGDLVYHSTAWYSWTAPSAGVIEFTAVSFDEGANFGCRAYYGATLDALTRVGTNSSPETTHVQVELGDVLSIQVASVTTPLTNGVPGSFRVFGFFRDAPATSPNTNFANRAELSLPQYHFDGGIRRAGVEPGEPIPNSVSNTLWWKITPAYRGKLTISAAAKAVWPELEFTPVLRLYEGESLQSLSPVAPGRDGSYALLGGREYALQVGCGEVLFGGLTLDASYIDGSDFFTNSTTLLGTNIVYVADLSTATSEPGEPTSGAANTVWASWQAPLDGVVRFYREGVPYSLFAVAFTGNSVNQLQPVTLVNSTNRIYDFLVQKDTVYHFQLSGGATATLYLQFYPSDPPLNDHFTNATQLYGATVHSLHQYPIFPITMATTETNEPQHVEGTFKTLWWKWLCPRFGSMYFSSASSTTSNVTLAVYKGSSMDTLVLQGKGQTNVTFPCNGGDTYYLAAVVPTQSTGGIYIDGQLTLSSAPNIPAGNILADPSWEIGGLASPYWNIIVSIGGIENGGWQYGGIDGANWPSFGRQIDGAGSAVSQNIQTVPGWTYEIRFAMRTSETTCGSGGGDGLMGVLWDGRMVGVGVLPERDAGSWYFVRATAIASNSISCVGFTNLARCIEADAFSVFPLTEPPAIVTQPKSLAVTEGGTAAFTVNVSGSSPLKYIWHFGNAPPGVFDEGTLVLDHVTSEQAGTYQVVVTNAYGSVTSAPVTLSVEVKDKPVILWQPYGEVVAEGSYGALSVFASGALPITYQWFKGENPVTDATNRTLVFPALTLEDSGSYSVRVQNPVGIAWSINANLLVTNALNGGGLLAFANHPTHATNVNAPVFDIDGTTKLSGTNYLAQLYAGPSLAALRPVSQPRPFNFTAGYFFPQIIALPNVPPAGTAVVQVRAWDGAECATYEEARSRGGKFGKSGILFVTLGGNGVAPAFLEGLQSFSLQAGLPEFNTGRITLIAQQEGGSILWSHLGEPGFRYVIEKSFEGFEWRPYLVITNVASTTTFADTTTNGASAVFYRSRILD